jgi:uncharacterized protein YaiE (UPF0345 family)
MTLPGLVTGKKGGLHCCHYFMVDIATEYSVQKTVPAVALRPYCPLDGPGRHGKQRLRAGKGPSMSEFKNVTVIKKANVYFDGKVTSRTVVFPDGSKKTLGVMLPGVYEFSTTDKEIMEIMSGELEVLLPGVKTWMPVRDGGSFAVTANSKFTMKVKRLTDYCCSFVKK